MDSKKSYDEQIEYAAGLLKKPPIEPTHVYFSCPKCGYTQLMPYVINTVPKQPEPGEQPANAAQWIRKNGRLICPFCDAETSYFTNWCSVCGKELM